MTRTRQKQKSKKNIKPQIHPDIPQQNAQSTAITIAIAAALIIAILIAFWGIWKNDFINFDDNEYITQNPNIQQGLTSDSIKWAFTTGHAGNWHPLTWLSHMLDCQLFDLNPAGHHTTNLLLHIANTLLLLWALKLMTGKLWPSAFIAALFAIHPLHVESVAWASERKDTLSTFFWMLTMIAYTRYTQTSHAKWYAASLLALTLGLMAKPMLVTLPFVLLLFDYWPLERKHIPIITLIKEKLPFIAIAATSSIITFLVQQGGDAVKGLYMLPLNFRIGNTFISYITYITKTILPINLAVFYPHPGNGLSWPTAILSAIILIAISLIILLLLKKHRYLTTGWLFFLGTLIPVIGLVQVGSQAIADRYTYIPLIGIFIIITYAAIELAEKYKLPPNSLKITAAIILITLIAFTHQQTAYWRNSLTLFDHAAKVVDNNYRAYFNMALFLSENRRHKEAANNFLTATKIKPQWPEAHFNLGLELFRLGKLTQAAEHYKTAIALNFIQPEIYNNLGLTLEMQGKLTEAAENYRHAIKLKPDYINARFGLATILAKQNKKRQAIKQYQQILKINPNHPQTKQQLKALTQKK